MTDQKATNVHWHQGDVTREDRNQLLGQKGATLWFTGFVWQWQKHGRRCFGEGAISAR
jgi:hypothetical protein